MVIIADIDILTVAVNVICDLPAGGNANEVISFLRR